MWKEAVVVYFDVISHSLRGGTEEYHVRIRLTDHWTYSVRVRELPDTKEEYCALNR
jgi:hypothetical protein